MVKICKRGLPSKPTLKENAPFLTNFFSVTCHIQLCYNSIFLHISTNSMWLPIKLIYLLIWYIVEKWLSIEWPPSKYSWPQQTLEENKVFFIKKIGQKVPQMAPIWLDQSAILDKLFSTRPLWLGSICLKGLWHFWLVNLINNQFDD
jgi:hypothetical protein